jgi:MFS superfamily sulfate permease-like transporter
MLLVVAATGHWWLPYVPMACLAGALLVAGLMQVPANLWSRIYARAAPATWSQSWLVALVFAASGGVGALAAGLLVATFVLLHASANTTLRRALLDGELRSRRLRHAASDSWLASRMRHVAVFQLQGLMSFGVAAHLCEQIVGTLRPDHRRVIVDASRVATWDATALARLVALARDLRREQRQLAACGLDGRSAAAVAAAVTVFTDLDHALEWAEDAMLEEMPRGERSLLPAAGRLGELADGLGAEGRQALEALLRHQEVEPQSQVFQAGDADSDLVVVQRGRITLCTAWPPASGLRLASVGQGMAFGEMAFLNDQPRTAWAGAEAIGAGLVRLARRDFDDWARAHPADALVFIANLAQIGTRRLAATTRQLRSVLE